jgi:hypothetical protein
MGLGWLVWEMDVVSLKCLVWLMWLVEVVCVDRRWAWRVERGGSNVAGRTWQVERGGSRQARPLRGVKG